MAELSQVDHPQLTQASEEAIGQLASVFSAYNEATERMRESYFRLQEDVAGLREELRQKNEQLERKSRLAALGEMAAGMAHEIRNPLGGVQLYASLLERDLQGQDGSLKWVQKIHNGVRTLDRIVSDILAFAHDQACEKGPVHVRSLVEDALDYCRPRLADSRVIIDLNGIDADLTMNADVFLMQRLLLNLLLNALDAVTPEGCVWIRAGRDVVAGETRVRLEVADNGGGIDADIMGRIFDPFFTTKDTGTGLGLAIVHRIVEGHGGVITASNNDRGGASFTILIP